MGLYIILMGVQGAGKGVQARFLQDEYEIPHVSTGDVFRAMKTRDDALARRVQKIMSAGQLVDDETTNEVVADRLSQDDAQNGVILDGYPRNQVQAEFLNKYLADNGESVTAVLLLDLDLYVAFKRAFGRVKSETGQTYNIYYMNDDLNVTFDEHPDQAYPPRIIAIHTDTGEVLKRRPDDANAAAVVKRIDTYLESTQPLIEFYRDAEMLHEVDADQRIEAVSADIQALIDRLR